MIFFNLQYKNSGTGFTWDDWWDESWAQDFNTIDALIEELNNDEEFDLAPTETEYRVVKITRSEQPVHSLTTDGTQIVLRPGLEEVPSEFRAI